MPQQMIWFFVSIAFSFIAWGFHFVSRDSRGCTEWAGSTVKPLRVSLVEPVAYLCDSYFLGTLSFDV